MPAGPAVPRGDRPGDAERAGERAPGPKPYDRRRLSYATTFRHPLSAGVIRSLEWLTGKPRLLRLIRRFEAEGVPEGQPFWEAALRLMGIAVETPAGEVARIPAAGPLVVVANHPHGLVDGMVLARLIGSVRADYKILVRALLTGTPEIERFLIPVPFPHDPGARAQNLAMRAAAVAQLGAGGAVALFPAGQVAASAGWFGPAVEADWHPFTAKLILGSGATVLPIAFPGQNSRAYQIANRISATLRQGLLLHEICVALDRPQRPVIGLPIGPEEIARRATSPRALLAWLRAHTLALGGMPTQAA